MAEPMERVARSSALESFHREYGYSPHSLISLRANTHSWVAPDGCGTVVYLPVGHVWLAAEPLSAAENLEEAARRFMEFARASSRLPAFVPVTERFATLSAPLGLDCAPIGMSPYFDLGEWNTSGRKRHALRAGVNQARRAGVVVEAVASGEVLISEMEDLCKGWNDGRRTSTFGWVFAPDPFGFPESKTLFVARDSGGALIGFLTASPMPARDASYLEDVQRVANAPRGTTDLLVVSAMEHLKQQGVRCTTLGTVPLFGVDRKDAIYRGRHDVARRVMSGVFRHGEAIYNFAGVHRFKARMDPTWWEHEYIMMPRRFLMVPRIVMAATRAIAPGGVWKALLSASWTRERAAAGE